jgi:hypothetical protein
MLLQSVRRIGTEQIDFDRPTVDRGIGPRPNLYCYELLLPTTTHRKEAVFNSRWSQDRAKTSSDSLASSGFSHAIALWDAFGVPLCPALYITVTIPVPVPTATSTPPLNRGGRDRDRILRKCHYCKASSLSRFFTLN